MNLQVIDEKSTAEKGCAVELVLINVGDTVANVEPFDVLFEWIPEFRPQNLIVKERIPKFSMAPGERVPLSITIPDTSKFMVTYYAIKNTMEDGNDQSIFPACSGTIVYFDQNKTERRTGFARAWNIKGSHSVTSKDPNDEYED